MAGEQREPPLGEQIRRRALSLFLADGVDATPLREIAAGLDVTKAALYYHYPSKDALVRALVTPYLDDLGAVLLAQDDARSGGGPVDHRGLLSVLVAVRRRHADTLGLLEDPAVRRVPRLAARTRDLWARSIAALHDDRAGHRGHAVAIGVLAVLDALARQPTSEISQDVVVDIAARLLVDGFTASPPAGR